MQCPNRFKSATELSLLANQHCAVPQHLTPNYILCCSPHGSALYSTNVGKTNVLLVANLFLFSVYQVMWVCNLCRKQQEILTKSGAWFYSGPGSAIPPGVTGVMRRRHEEAPQEKKAKLQDAPLLYQGTTVERSRAPSLLRQHSVDPDR